MSRVAQPAGARGSLKWIQTLVNQRPDLLDRGLAAALPGAPSIRWLSPRAEDEYAEYRDAAFLDLIGAGDLVEELAAFWPSRGPQWDALGRSEAGDLILVEAKAHIAEVFSPGTQASAQSRAKIERALLATAEALGATPRAAWADVFFQYANRLAHLDFLRRLHGRPAWLVFLYLTGDEDMNGPASEAEWKAALQVVKYILGLSSRHHLANYVIDVFIDIREISRKA